MTNSTIIRSTARGAVVLPIFLGYALNIAYCLYLYKFIKLNIGCNIVMPQLSKYASHFSTEQFCEANNILWSGLIYFYLIVVCVFFSVFAINWNFRVLKTESSIQKYPSGHLLRHYGKSLWLILSLILTAIYFFSHLKLTRIGFSESSISDLQIYAWEQVVGLHVFVGLTSFIGTIVFLVPQFKPSEN